MATFNWNKAALSEHAYVLAACIFPVHVWSIINTMREVSGWVARYSLWDVLGGVAYTQVFALFESIFLFVMINLFAFALPYKWFRARRVAMSGVVALLTSLWLIILHYNQEMMQDRQWLLLGVWAASYLVALAGGAWLLFRRPAVETAVTRFVWRLAPLSYLYFAVDLISIGLVTVRNL